MYTGTRQETYTVCHTETLLIDKPHYLIHYHLLYYFLYSMETNLTEKDKNAQFLAWMYAALPKVKAFPFKRTELMSTDDFIHANEEYFIRKYLEENGDDGSDIWERIYTDTHTRNIAENMIEERLAKLEESKARSAEQALIRKAKFDAMCIQNALSLCK